MNELETTGILLVAVNSLIIGLSFAGSRKTMLSGAPFGGDFVEFYTAGKILNTFGADRLYDFQLQADLSRIYLPSGLSIPYVTPPFVAILFSPLAHLPLWLAFLIWILISIALYLAAIKLILRLVDLPPRMTFLVCLGFPPFFMLVLAGGQISAIGCFMLALWIYLMKKGKKTTSGCCPGINAL